MREQKIRLEGEIEKLTDYITKLESDKETLSGGMKFQEAERHKLDLRMVELTESIKSQALTYDRQLEVMQREKESEISRVLEDL
jgi:hypothetical protein